jgi:hypothetical protein
MYRVVCVCVCEERRGQLGGYISSDSPISRSEGTSYGCCMSGLQIIPSLFDVAFHAQLAQLAQLYIRTQ